jgi:AcrR family transcriptional regulator
MARKPVRGGTSERSGAATRAHLIESTIDCILDDGFYRASSNRIAERAGVSWGVIQYHFGTREDLLVAAFEHGMRELLDLLEGASVTGETFDERLESFIDVLWSFYRQPRFVAYEQLTLNLTHDPDIEPDTAAMVANYHTTIGRRLSALVADVVDRDAMTVLPAGSLLQIVRGVAIGMSLADALPGRPPRAAGTGDAAVRRVLTHALGALVREGGSAARA